MLGNSEKEKKRICRLSYRWSDKVYAHLKQNGRDLSDSVTQNGPRSAIGIHDDDGDAEKSRHSRTVATLELTYCIPITQLANSANVARSETSFQSLR